MMSLDRWGDGGAGSRFGGGVAAAFFLLSVVSALLFSLFPLLPLSTTFFSLCSGFMEMLGSGLDDGQPFFLFFSMFFFSSVHLSFRFFLLLLTGLLSTVRAMAVGGDAGGGGKESYDASRWL